MTLDPSQLDAAYRAARDHLLSLRTPDGHWVGELSSSALSTATAVWALALVDRATGAARFSTLVRRGLAWLVEHQNADGGWGDTTASASNLSTTLLAWSALAASPGGIEHHEKAIAAAEAWLRQHAGGLEPERLAAAVATRYGKDRTFSAPILTTCALAGRLGRDPAAWRLVPALPFELAACPHRWWSRLRLPVVSYALPALVAIGQARHHFHPTRNPLLRLVRNSLREKTLDIARSMQPPSGGYLEAVPLTSFVTMSLAAIGRAGHEVVRRGAAFLEASVRPDGSWPIDTHLATWVTTLAVNALARKRADARKGADAFSGCSEKGSDPFFAADNAAKVRNWLLAQQHLQEHEFTHAAPGGWAWTDLPGGVPDADDTAGALLALAHLGPPDDRTREAAAHGVAWLLGLQNRDGGIPTFCRGWGALPFDRSSPDLTAHALQAWAAWRDHLPQDLQPRVDGATARALAYLERSQKAVAKKGTAPSGAWVPLWFGNEAAPKEENPTYGTARVLAALAAPACRGDAAAARMAARGIGWLLAAQNADGGWGGARGTPSSIEETALAVDALARFLAAPTPHAGIDRHALRLAVGRGTAWLIEHTRGGTTFDPAPIGFYFAKLWYFERLYPVIFTVAALGRIGAVGAW
jgi:squalene-hopene/tetraprenyl-beta-curcumene cyclase